MSSKYYTLCVHVDKMIHISYFWGATTILRFGNTDVVRFVLPLRQSLSTLILRMVFLFYQGHVNPCPALWGSFSDCCEDRVRLLAAK